MAVYSEAELYSDHEFANLHEVHGQRMHGGFDASGRYQPPRAKGRGEAMAAWATELKQRGGDLFEADSSLLAGPRMPSVKQQCLLLAAGLGTPFWNSLTITGKIEGRGRVLAEMEFPDLQDIIVEDISGMAIGHLNKGLLAVHGLDEGGEPDKGIGGHDVMWFVARDLVFGKDAYPDVEPPESISRPEAGKRWMEEIEPQYEGLLSFLMNLLMIEFRAEIGFAATQDILRNPELFTDCREQAEEAAEIVERIRTDEEIHVESLRLYLGELRELTVRTTTGATIKGSELIDRFWTGLVHWATQEQPAIAAANSYQTLRPAILAHDNGKELLASFDALTEAQSGAGEVSAG